MFVCFSLLIFMLIYSVEKKSRPEATVKDVPKPKVRPPCAAPKLDATKYANDLCNAVLVVAIQFQFYYKLFTFPHIFSVIKRWPEAHSTDLVYWLRL